MQAGSRYGYLGYLQLHQRILHLHFPCTNGIFNSSSANQNPALTPLQHVRSSEVPKLPQLLDEQLDSSCHIHASCCPRIRSQSCYNLLFKSLKMPSTKNCCSSSEMIRVDLDASKKLLLKSSKNQSDRSCSGFSLISSRSINSGLLLLATDHHVVEEESKTTRKTPAFSNSVNSWDFLSSSSCSFFFWESVSSCSSFSRPG
jgi:hypothetical protein